MKRKLLLISYALILIFGIVGNVNAAIIGGIDFPDGVTSFADEVYSYTPGPDVSGDYTDPTRALGVPNSSSVSLGDGGTLILQFTDNSLTTSGDAAPDLYVFEAGAVTEWMNIAISRDALNWLDLGDLRGQPTSIDIDSVPGIIAGTSYSFIRISDILPNQTGSPYGEADIDAVGAISSAPPVPIPGAFWLLGSGLIALVGIGRKR